MTSTGTGIRSVRGTSCVDTEYDLDLRNLAAAALVHLPPLCGIGMEVAFAIEVTY